MAGGGPVALCSVQSSSGDETTPNDLQPAPKSHENSILVRKAEGRLSEKKSVRS
jgi:hypothetical protein